MPISQLDDNDDRGSKLHLARYPRISLWKGSMRNAFPIPLRIVGLTYKRTRRSCHLLGLPTCT